jgi:hypothetical protein
MLDDSRESDDRGRKPVSDSPWFWLMLFLVTALCAIVVVSPKYMHRQARLERMNATRDQIARQAAGMTSESDEGGEFIDHARDSSRPLTLGPLAIALSIFLALSAVAAGVLSHLRSASRREDADRQRKTA